VIQKNNYCITRCSSTDNRNKNGKSKDKFQIQRSCRSSRTLTHVNLKDTLTIIRPNFWHLSPCWGAALSCTPVIGNMMRIGQLQQKQSVNGTSRTTVGDMFGSNCSRNLASTMFWQSDRWSPIQLTRKLSQPASYLTPRLMGILWYVATSSTELSEKEQRLILHREGIRSNYVNNTQWTGVSMTRWLDLLQSINNHPFLLQLNSSSTQRKQYHHDNLVHVFSVAPWLAGLWEISQTKEDLLEYLLALDESYNGTVLDDSIELVQAIKSNDLSAKQEWTSSSFKAYELTSEKVYEYLDELLRIWSTPSSMFSNKFEEQKQTAALIELICASQSIQYGSKPIVPNSRYGYDDGDEKPDCVEVLVREIFDLLLWDDSKEMFDLSRLPGTPHLEAEQTPRAPKSKHLLTLRDLYQASNYTNQSRSVKKSNNTGQQWFNACSNIPGCDYLSASPHGKPYELTPTMRNVSKAMQHLLGLNGIESKILVDAHNTTKLETIMNLWNDRQDVDKSGNGYSMSIPNVQINTFQRSYRPSMSDEMVHEEHATIYLDGSKYGIAIKLEAAHDHASVTHLRMQQKGVHPTLGSGLLRIASEPVQNNFNLHYTALLLIMVVFGTSDGHCNNFGERQKQNQFTEQDMHQAFCSNVLLAVLLSIPFGPDRRSSMDIKGTSDLNLEEKSLSEVLQKSLDKLHASVAIVCEHKLLIDELKHILLTWLLQEWYIVVPQHSTHTSQHYSYFIMIKTENEILGLNPYLLVSLPIESTTWACRQGPLLGLLLQYKLGKISGIDFLMKWINDCHSKNVWPMISTFGWYVWKLYR
jgi:hypothetical protein